MCRTRMAIAGNGKLITIALGSKTFGKDEQIDKLTRKFDHIGTETMLKQMNDNDELKENAGAVAHMVHGSSEGRLYTTHFPGHLTKDEVESVRYQHDDLQRVSEHHDVNKIKDRQNTMEDTSEVTHHVSNPALGLWL